MPSLLESSLQDLVDERVEQALSRQIEKLQKELKTLKQRVTELELRPRPGPGRPRKRKQSILVLPTVPSAEGIRFSAKAFAAQRNLRIPAAVDSQYGAMDTQSGCHGHRDRRSNCLTAAASHPRIRLAGLHVAPRPAGWACAWWTRRWKHGVAESRFGRKVRRSLQNWMGATDPKR